MCDIVFEKAKKKLWWGSKQDEGLCKSNFPIVFYKKVYWEISQNSQEIICIGVSFLIKLDTVDLQLNYNQTPTQVFCCEFCEICKITFFAEHHRTTASDYSSINSS